MINFDSAFSAEHQSQKDEKMGKPELFGEEKMAAMHHMPYMGMCAPGFVPLDEICVLNDRCGPGAYPGKVCVMDGVAQPYLRPLHQGNAGIPATNVICAEGLNLIFKSHDNSPVCVKPESVSKLKNRGWSVTPPGIACTLEYAPVCGVNEKTYGNMCMLNSEHIALKHKGECDAMELTEFELDKQFQETQSMAFKVSSKIYNGMYNGDLPLDEALQILVDAKNTLDEVYQKYQSLDDSAKTDRQIAMRFSTFGKMGTASLESQIKVIENQIKNPSSEKTSEQIQDDIEKSFSVKYNAIRNVIKNYEESFEDGKYVGVMTESSMRKSIYDSQIKIFGLYDDLEDKKDMISDELYQEVSAELPILDDSVQNMWGIINEHMGISSVTSDALRFTWLAPEINPEKGYFVEEIADDVYWLVSSGYQTMFVTTGEGVVIIDKPQPMGEKYLDAIEEVTSEPITHMIYSHHHQDHTGGPSQILSDNTTLISHIKTANVLAQENDPSRPVPTETFDGKMHTINVGNKTIELHYLGDFHSDGDILILLPDNRAAMLVDLLRPAESPYRAFGVTPDIDLYLETHDTLQTFDFDVLVSGHTGILTTKEHIKTNKQFTLDVMENAQTALDGGVSDPVQYCADKTIDKWDEKLGNLDAFMADHCNAMLEYHSSQ